MNKETNNFLKLRESTQFIEITDSTLLKRIVYDYKSEEMTVYFINNKYYTEEIT